MSHIDDLIATLAPEGVEFKPVGEITTKSSNIKWGSSGDDEFQYIDLSSVDRVTRRIGGTATVTAVNAPSRAKQIVHTGDVIFATTRPAQMRWAVITAEYDGQIASTGYCVLRPDTSVVLTNFLAHILGSDIFRQYVEENQVAGNYPSIPDNRVRAYRIPVPPLEVQREIVRILDHFTALEAELEAELETRRRQYGHYRDALFGDINHERWVPLSQIGRFQRGSSLQKKNLTDAGVPAFHYGQVYTHYGVSAVTTKSFVSQEFSLNKRCLNPGDVFVATTSENEEDLGKAVAWLGDEPAVASSDAYIYRSDADARFISHFFASEHFQLQKKKFVTGTKVKRLSGDAIGKIRIPFPSRSEQEIIADSLDRFETLVNDLSVGLPAELAARRKQYEYYRDKLLTFEEAPA